jgi:hypothetical protein
MNKYNVLDKYANFIRLAIWYMYHTPFIVLSIFVLYKGVDIDIDGIKSPLRIIW